MDLAGPDLEVQAVQDRGRGVAGHPVARVDDDLEPPSLDRREAAQVGRVVVEDVVLLDRAGLVRGHDAAVRDEVADVGEAGVGPHRSGVRAAELDAVVARRVVARGEHRTGDAEVAGGEVELVGGGQPDAHDVSAACHDALGERMGQGFGRRAHVLPDNHGPRAVEDPEHVDDRAANRPGHFLVQLVGNDTPDVVGLEDRIQVGHGRPTLVGPPSTPGCRRALVVPS